MATGTRSASYRSRNQAASALTLVSDGLHRAARRHVLLAEPLEIVEDRSIYIEEYARGMIGQEELHTLELTKMLRDFGPEA